MSEAKERPIIFSGPMVRAILEGRKTQTRRVVSREWTSGFIAHDGHGQTKTLPVQDIYWNDDYQKWWAVNTVGYPPRTDPSPMHLFEFDCPYGQPGELLWVRETRWINGGYTATDEANFKNEGKSPAIYMPRHLSRITLEIVSVRVERLQEITHRDALAEGVEYDVSKPDGAPVFCFETLWDTINAKRGYSWESNPFVWVLSFKVITPANSAMQPTRQLRRAVDGER